MDHKLARSKRVTEALDCHNIKLIMFDLDGTLVDSVPDLAHAVDAMLNALGEEKAGLENVRLWVGNGAHMLVKRALSKAMVPPTIDEGYLEKAMTLFFECYHQVNGTKSQLYPNVLKTLNQLRQHGYSLALVTNKPAQFTQPLLDSHHLTKFDLVVCGDTLATKKPDPAQLLYCLETFNCQPNEALMVGDSVSDINAAKAAKVPIVCVSYGYHQGEDLSMYDPDLFINNIEFFMRN